MEKEKIILPEAFKVSMKELLGSEYEEFEKSYEKERFAGLRFNPLKASLEHFMDVIPYRLTPVAWAKEGFYYDLSEQPGKSVLHEAGAYYIQEPSAMCAVSLLDPKPGDCVLDLCAAPGGKSSQIAGRLEGKGVLVSNEIISDRAKILSSNIERMGVRNACVLNESAPHLSNFFSSFFDKILVDAPCSGEGMFKKEENAISEWSPENVISCHERQLQILDEAAKMLKAGGVLVYSTCTFNKTENEGTVETFLNTHPEFSLEKFERYYPHRVKGEGHFAARLKKAGELSSSDFSLDTAKKKKDKGASKNDPAKDLYAFLTDELKIKEEAVASLLSDNIINIFGDNIYLTPARLSSLKGLKVERPGLHVAVSKKNRLEPSHSLALSLKPGEVKNEYILNDDEALRYIKGETISCDYEKKGWLLLTYKGYSVGYGKASGGTIKNHYPKGLRKC